MNHYLAIDPGEKRTGWATFAENGDPIGMGVITGDADDFMDWLEELDPQPKEIIFEGYWINPTISHGFSEALTIQLIGMIRRYAKKQEIKLHKQRNTDLKVALRHAGFYGTYYHVTGPKRGQRIKHVDDQISAFAHGKYWLIKNGVIK